MEKYLFRSKIRKQRQTTIQKIDRFNLFFLITKHTFGTKKISLQNLWLGLNKQYKHVERTYISTFRFTSPVFGHFRNWKFPLRLYSFFFRQTYLFFFAMRTHIFNITGCYQIEKNSKDRAEKIFAFIITFYRFPRWFVYRKSAYMC